MNERVVWGVLCVVCLCLCVYIEGSVVKLRLLKGLGNEMRGIERYFFDWFSTSINLLQDIILVIILDISSSYVYSYACIYVYIKVIITT